MPFNTATKKTSTDGLHSLTKLDDSKETVMHITITTLVDNCVYGKNLKGEHGLSLFVDTGTHRFLFDTGASNLLLANAQTLGIDLSTVDFVILSHGHRDHTGGLEAFLTLNTKARVLAKPNIIYKKFTVRHENGMPQLPQSMKDRFIFIEDFTEYLPNVFIIPQIAITYEEATHRRGFFIEKEGETFRDDFSDELAVVIKTKKGYALLTACSHLGVTNIIEQLKTHFNLLHLELILGGFHLIKSPKEDIERVAYYLFDNVKGSVGLCHCTGIEAYPLFQNRLNKQVFYNHTGKEIKLEL